MSEYLECYLEDYEEFFDEDYYLVLYLMSILPSSYQYLFTTNFIKHKHHLIKGDIRTGEKTIGTIQVTDNKIILTTKKTTKTLLDLPSPWEL